jgi:hypothetical protein
MVTKKLLCGLWKRGELTDVVLVASNGRELAAHRAVLSAYSQVLFNSCNLVHSERKIIAKKTQNEKNEKKNNFSLLKLTLIINKFKKIYKFPVFLAMFTHETVEKAQGRVVIPDADSQVLGQMLEWMYTGKRKTPYLGDPLVACGLLAVADKYQLDDLKVVLFDSMYIIKTIKKQII